MLLPVPRYSPTGLREQLRAWIEADRALSWCEFEAEPGMQHTPSYQLQRRFTSQSGLATAATLVESERFAGRAIWIDGLDGVNWPDWRRFLHEYGHACRNIEPPTRTVLCLFVPGDLEPLLPQDDVCWVRLAWRGQVSRLDMQLHLGSLLLDRGLSPLYGELVASVGAELAGEDFGLAQVIAEGDMHQVMEPMEFLRRYAQERRWQSAAPDWMEGTGYVRNGRLEAHSALMAVKDRTSEVARRVWRGQVGLLLGYIEEERVRIVRALRGRLRTPFETEFGVVHEPEHLEIQYVHILLRSDGSVSRAQRQRISLLRQVRNRLAHLEPVPSHELEALIGKATG